MLLLSTLGHETSKTGRSRVPNGVHLPRLLLQTGRHAPHELHVHLRQWRQRVRLALRPRGRAQRQAAERERALPVRHGRRVLLLRLGHHLLLSRQRPVHAAAEIRLRDGAARQPGRVGRGQVCFCFLSVIVLKSVHRFCI